VHHSPAAPPLRTRARGRLTSSYRLGRRALGHRSSRLVLATMVSGAATTVALLGPLSSQPGQQPTLRPYDSSTSVAGSSSSIGDPAVATDAADDAVSSTWVTDPSSGGERPAARPAAPGPQAAPGTSSPAVAPGTGAGDATQAAAASTTEGAPAPSSAASRAESASAPETVAAMTSAVPSASPTAAPAEESAVDSTEVSRARETCPDLPGRSEHSRRKQPACDPG
jgi:hypothetical protein